MDEVGVKKLIKDAIEASCDDCEVTVHRRGLTLEFVNGDKFRLPEPLDLSEDRDDELDLDEDDE
jgi:hypothetical protein